MGTIVVTGASGFIGGHVILKLLAAGHDVRATVRTLAREPEVRAMLRAGGVEAGGRLSFHAADLEADAGWADAAAGCDVVHHVASPFPISAPRDEDDLIRPAREGTLRVLRAARDAGARRVVLTSSFAAIGYGHPPRATPFDETDWTDVAGADTQAYMKSKTLAERAAWDFIGREGGALELAVINPVAVFGPALGPDLSSSVQIVQALLSGRIPAAPNIHFGIVDVRDVADLHLSAMDSAAAAGERFLAVAGPSMSIHDVAMLLRARLGAAAARVPRRRAPDWLIRAAAVVSADARSAVPHLGTVREASNAKARSLLGWQPRSNAEALIATAESLIRLGLAGGRA